jgi:hypothetical protein
VVLEVIIARKRMVEFIIRNEKRNEFIHLKLLNIYEIKRERPNKARNCIHENIDNIGYV